MTGQWECPNSSALEGRVPKKRASSEQGAPAGLRPHLRGQPLPSSSQLLPGRGVGIAWTDHPIFSREFRNKAFYVKDLYFFFNVGLYFQINGKTGLSPSGPACVAGVKNGWAEWVGCSMPLSLGTYFLSREPHPHKAHIWGSQTVNSSSNKRVDYVLDNIKLWNE